MIPPVGFVGGARYRPPLDRTLDRKFALLATVAPLCVVARSTDARPRIFVQHARFYTVPLAGPWLVRSALMLVVGQAFVLWCIFRHGVRILVAQSPHEGVVAAWSKMIARLIRIRVALVVESHADFEEGLLLYRDRRWMRAFRLATRSLAAFTLRRADVLRAVSRETAEQLRRWAPGRPVVQVPTWTDLDGFLEQGAVSVVRERTVLYVGTLARVKGVHLLVDAFAAAAGGPMADARLRIVGPALETGWAQRLRARVAALGMDGRTTFLGRQPQARIAEEMRRAAVVAVPSLSEGLPRVILEAMATGAPVIASRVGGTGDLVQDGVTGLLVPPGDIAALARGISWMLSHPTDAEEMGRRGREAVGRHFTADRYRERYAEVFELARQALARDGA